MVKKSRCVKREKKKEKVRGSTMVRRERRGGGEEG